MSETHNGDFQLHRALRLYLLTPLYLLTGCGSAELRMSPMTLPSPALTEALSDMKEDDAITFTECLSGAWWEVFNDDQLSSFIASALERNPTLQIARANILLAAASAERVRSVLYPNLLWAADVSRQKLSETGLIPFHQQPVGVAGPAPAQLAATGGVAGIPVYFTQFETELNLSYDFDIWGKNRNTWAAALDEVQANVADEAFAHLALSIAVGQVYFQLRVDYKRLEAAKRLVELNDRFVELTQNRVDYDLDTGISLQTTKTNLSAAKQSLLEIEGNIAISENKLRAYLAGDFDEAIVDLSIEDKALPKAPVPRDLPLHLIRYRPDVVAQLWLIESAGKQVDVARAGFYPDVNLNALFGYQTLKLHKLFEWPSVFFNVDPAISLPIFDGGLLEANLSGSRVNYSLAVYEYNQKILDAVREVLDGLALVRNTGQQLEENNRKLKDQEEIFQLTRLRADNNLDSDLDLIISEAQVLRARDQELIVLGKAFQAVLTLIKATGGGYEACYLEDEG